MNLPLWQSLGRVADRIARGAGVWLASDFDGTLCPIRPHPDEVELSPRGRRVLERLAATPGVRVGIFSGRALEDLARRVGAPGVFLAGSGGLEYQDPLGARHTHPSAGAGVPPELAEALRAWCARFPGAWLELKGPSLAVHYRAVADEAQGAFRAGVRRRAGPFRDRVRLLHGKKAFEVLPAASRGKPDAMRHWLDGVPAHDALVFYFGDDANDEECYPLVREHGGYAVAVGRLRTRAPYVLASPAELLWFLEWLERELAVHRAAPAGTPGA